MMTVIGENAWIMNLEVEDLEIGHRMLGNEVVEKRFPGSTTRRCYRPQKLEKFNVV